MTTCPLLSTAAQKCTLGQLDSREGAGAGHLGDVPLARASRRIVRGHDVAGRVGSDAETRRRTRDGRQAGLGVNDIRRRAPTQGRWRRRRRESRADWVLGNVDTRHRPRSTALGPGMRIPVRSVSRLEEGPPRTAVLHPSDSSSKSRSHFHQRRSTVTGRCMTAPSSPPSAGPALPGTPDAELPRSRPAARIGGGEPLAPVGHRHAIRHR